ncbi:MAG: hypothetical protein A3E85_00730 [Gammaproteobacteria bacterium RIFCSPHIGHO2_12_FULL_45_12]|nr:MAG: hypothetical protein A3E85_00730 [Gammaproteobacteria bacterium RIFCSPHIGHO2_12_FULL_45_12]
MPLFNKKNIVRFLTLAASFLIAVTTKATPDNALANLKTAYPDFIKKVSHRYIFWKDGTILPLRITPNGSGPVDNDDDGRVRYEYLFRKMYGNSRDEVEKNLVIIYWMPHVYGKRYPLQVTRINGVDKRLMRVSAALEKLPRTFYKYVKNPQGTYCWRNIAHTYRLSTHSFGTTIDINRKYSDYWQWDLEKTGRKISETAPVKYRNRIPLNIVRIFQQNGFIWGGDWEHYDTMHFEYRPELATA